MMRMRMVLLLCLAQLAGAAWAQTQTTYHGCTDAAGNAVPAILDTAIAGVLESRVADGAAAIHYNPQALPRLLPETRLFLFAHECARHNLGLDVGPVRRVEDARRADCQGLDTLMRSRLLGDRQIELVQTDLSLSSSEWPLVPGPVRDFALRACVAERASSQALARPAAGQPDWNACVRACGERRRACRQAAATCDATYERCVSLCDFRSPP